MDDPHITVTPAEAGVQCGASRLTWMPVFTGMTDEIMTVTRIAAALIGGAPASSFLTDLRNRCCPGLRKVRHPVAHQKQALKYCCFGLLKS